MQSSVKMSRVVASAFFLLLVLHQGVSRKGTWTATKSKTQSDGALNFLILGDWGGQPSYPYTTTAEVELAGVMGTKASEIGSQFTLALGDNFYNTGVRDVKDKRFKDTFEDVFTASSLQKPWYVICGNHDHYGNCSAEIAYSKVSERWTFPDFYYTEEFDIPGTNSSVAILFIDTVLLAGLSHPMDRSRPPPGPASLSASDEQWDFIEKTLSAWSQPSPKNRWKIVVGHYPVWSVAEHGPTKELVEKLKPLLEKYGVTAYFCGHDHNMQHLNDSGVQYFVTGAGHLVDPSNSHKNDVPTGSLKYFYGPSSHTTSTGAFSAITATKTSFTVRFIDAEGKELYSSVTTRPPPPPPPPQ